MTKEKKGGARIPPILKGFENVGDIPQALRERAEYVVSTEETVEKMKEELKKETKTLQAEMVKLKIPVVPVIVGNWKKRVTLERTSETFKLKIIDEGVDDAGDDADTKKLEPKVSAPK